MDRQTGDTPIINSNISIKSPFPHEVLQIILQSLGPLDLNACRRVCRIWRKEVNRRYKALKRFHVREVQNLLDGIELLKAPSPQFEIQFLLLLEGTDPYHAHPSFTTFLQAISPITLGKILIDDNLYLDIQPHQLQMILGRFPNLFCLEFDATDDEYEPDMDCTFLFQTQDHLDQVTNAIFPALKTLICPHHWCSLSIVLRACPNITSLRLSRLVVPYDADENIDGTRLKCLTLGHIDPQTLRQLREIGLSLTTFDVTFRDEPADNWEEMTVDYDTHLQNLVQTFHEFMATQTSSLIDLTLYYDLNFKVPIPLFPLPQPLSILTKLETGVEFGELNDILDSVPEVVNLLLISPLRYTKKWRDEFFQYPWKTHTEISSVQVHTLEIGYIIRPQDLTMFGSCFKNLNKLVLGTVIHGLLHTVYIELARLTHLEITEECRVDKDSALHDSDFIRTLSDSSVPYIGNMTNLKELVITFRYDRFEDLTSDEDDGGSAHTPPCITDAILTQGIFAIVGQLDKLDISGAKFTQRTLETLRSCMILHLGDQSVSGVKTQSEPLMGQMELIWTTRGKNTKF